jgi:signal transduction histidine kinase
VTEILIIDDSPDDRELLTDMLHEVDGFRTHAINSGHQALAYVAENLVDCVLLDYRRQGEDGLAILTALKSRNLFLPVVMISGDGNEELAAAAVCAGAKGYLSKSNINAGKLETAIRTAITECQKDLKNTGTTENVALRVLLVEDNDDDRENIAEMIRASRSGVSVEAAANGTEALAYFRESDPDCVILDYRLEAEDGLDILAEFKAISPFTPVVMLTGQGNEEVAARCIKVGAADYLIKQRLNETYLRSAIENAISRSALEARVADQDDERRQFLNILVHDLRQPLRNVRTLGEMAQEDLATGDFDQLQELLSSQAQVATRADELIQVLAGYAILDQDVPFADVPLLEAAQAATDNLSHHIAERKAKVTLNKMPAALGNKAQLIQLFQNLIGNGLKYNQSETPQITVEVESTNEKDVVISVADNGIGIPEKHLQGIFAPLKRLWAQQQYEGTGLGLATCQKIVTKHKGIIWCTSVEGEGSKFHIRFRLATAPEQ